MKRLTKKRVEYLKNMTNLCYKVSLGIVCSRVATITTPAYQIMDDFKFMSQAPSLLIKTEPSFSWYLKLKNEIGDKYLELINTLNDEDLQDILNCHNKGKFFRADKTINSIVSEISRRSLGDSSESKLIYILKKVMP